VKSANVGSGAGNFYEKTTERRPGGKSVGLFPMLLNRELNLFDRVVLQC
jgi:hypothetical protein